MSNIVNHHFEELSRLIIRPSEFWYNHDKINIKTKKLGEKLFLRLYLPILAVLALTVFMTEFFGSPNFYSEYAVGKAIRITILYILQYYLSVYVTNQLLSSFGALKNKEKVKQLIVYSMIPFFAVTFITSIFPFLYILNLLGFYSFYIFYTGVNRMFEFEDRNKMRFILIAIVTNFFIFSFLNITLWKILSAFI